MLGLLCVLEKSPVAFVLTLRHLINQKERFILYEIAHKTVAKALRDFAEQHRWTRADISANDPAIPKELQVMKPSAVWIFEDRVELDFGGAFLSFGFRVFKPGTDGYGTKRLDEGVWCYSEDNRVPTDE